MSNITRIFDKEEYSKPNEELIEGLESVLEFAKKGEYTSGAVIMLDPINGSILSAKYIGEGCKIFELLGALDYLKHRILINEIEWSSNSGIYSRLFQVSRRN